jgi:hypothetical protein
MCAMMVLSGCDLVILAGHNFHLEQVASDAQQEMIGMPKERVLACMGDPRSRTNEGETEVWQYFTVDSSTRFNPRSCFVDVIFTDGRVTHLSYTVYLEGFLTPNAQCAEAVKGCMQ